MFSFVTSPFAKVRSMISGTPKENASLPTTYPTVDRHTRPVSMASTVTVVPPSPIPPIRDQASLLVTLEHQRDLIADFWSGSAAGRSPTHPAASAHSLSSSSNSHSSSSSHASADGPKTKWGAAIMSKEGRGVRTQAEPEPVRDPSTPTKLLFILGFMFPLLWLAGALFLFVPSKPRAARLVGLPVHATQERDRRVAIYRAAEDRWAKRCLWAWVATLAVVSVLAVAVAVARRGGA